MTEKDYDIVTDTPIERLPYLLGNMSDEQKKRAKARMRETRHVDLQAQAEMWRGKQRARAMTHPAVVQIAMMRNGDPVCGMIALIPNEVPGSRPIQEGERILVDIEEPRVAVHIRERNLEVVMEAPTRPLIFNTKEAAQATDPRRSHQMPPGLTAAYQADIREFVLELYAELEEVRSEQIREEDKAFTLDAETEQVLREQYQNDAAKQAAEHVADPAPGGSEDTAEVLERRRVLKRSRAKQAAERLGE